MTYTNPNSSSSIPPSQRSISPPSQTEHYYYTSLCRPYEQPTPSNSVSRSRTTAISQSHISERSRQELVAELNSMAAIGRSPAAKMDKTQVVYSGGTSVTGTYEEVLYHDLSQVLSFTCCDTSSLHDTTIHSKNHSTFVNCNFNVLVYSGTKYRKIQPFHNPDTLGRGSSK